MKTGGKSSDTSHFISYSGQEALAAYIFLLPAILSMLIFVFYPMLHAFVISFKDYNLIGSTSSFIGLKNYADLVKDHSFLASLGHSFYFAVIVIPAQTIIALGLALLVRRKWGLSSFFRTLYFIPVVISIAIASTIFKMMYNKSYGLLNSLLNTFNIPSSQFLSDPHTSMIGLILMCIWKSAGFFMIIFLAGLNNISQDLYEAAEVDGASSWQKFFSITLPLLKRTMGFVVIITTMDAIKIAAPIFILTEGGPASSTTTAVYFIFKQAFTQMNMGYATAASFILFLIVLCISLLQLRFFKSDLEY